MEPENEPSESDHQQFTMALLRQMALNAMGPEQFLDPRTGLIFKRAGFATDSDPPGQVEEELIVILRDPAHGRRIVLPPGPLICHFQEGVASRSILDTRNLVLVEDRKIREAALEHLQHLRGLTPRCLTPRSEATLAEQSGVVRSEDDEQWDGAAIRLHDVLIDDLLLTLAGFIQCRSLNYVEGSNDFLNEILRPSLSAIEFLPLPVLSPSQEREALRDLISGDASRATNIEEAASFFMDLAGHLPLDRPLGLALVMERWIEPSPSPDVWERVWRWADGAKSPAARYHACLLFLGSPELVPEGGWATLRDEILDIVGSCLSVDVGAEARRAVEWRIRSDLARHYVQHFEVSLPGLDSERIAHLAWWLTERIARAFDGNLDHLRKVQAEIVRPTCEFTSGLWEVIRPPLAPSPLRFATLFTSSPWSLSLMAQLGPLHSTGPLTDLFGDRHSELEGALTAGLLLGAPATHLSDETWTHGFDRTLLATAERWASERNDADKTCVLHGALAYCRGSANVDELTPRLDRLTIATLEEQTVIVHQLRVVAFSDAPPDGPVFDRLIDQGWARKALAELPFGVLEVFCDALFELHHRHGGRWREGLPHIFASAALDRSIESGRRTLLFAYGVLFSIAAGTTGAVTRILLSEDRDILARAIDHWRGHLEELYGVCSPWAQSRIRPVLAHLSAGQGMPTDGAGGEAQPRGS